MCLDREGRAVLTEHHVTLREVGVAGKEVESAGRLVVVNVYCPMYDPARDKDGGGVSRLTVKTNFYKLLEIRVRALEKAGKCVCLCVCVCVCTCVLIAGMWDGVHLEIMCTCLSLQDVVIHEIGQIREMKEIGKSMLGRGSQCAPLPHTF